MKKHIKLIIAIIVIVIVIISLLITLIILNKKEERNLYEKKNDVNRATYIPRTDEEVKIPSVYYTIENILQKYFSYIFLDYNEKEQMDPNIKVGTLAENYNIFNKEDKRKSIIKLLDYNYIEENNININNIDDFIEINERKIEKCQAIEMIEREAKTIKAYGVHVKIKQEADEKDEFYIVTLDFLNRTFMIRPMAKCKNINEIDLSFVENILEIPKQEINTFATLTIGESEMAQKYFDNFKELLLNNPKGAYEKLSKEYRDKRFGDYDKFLVFLKKNEDEIRQIKANKYLVNDINGDLQYVCKDKYNNDYIFNTTGVMKYTVELDTYTIISDNFETAYKKAKKEEKVSMNIQKWIQMLNNRDYYAAYKVLDTRFKIKNFETVEMFEEYMKDKYPQHYQIKEGTTNEENSIYTSRILIESLEENNVIDMTIIMQLKENMEFALSFGIE